MGIFEWFVFAFGDGHQDDALVFTEIEEGRADEISDIFDEEYHVVLEGELRDGGGDHLGFEVAAFAGVDLDRGGSCGADLFSIKGCGLIPFDDCTRLADLAQGSFQ